MIKKPFLILLIICVSAIAFAQESYTPEPASPTFILQNLRNNCLKAESDKEVDEYNQRFKAELKKMLEQNIEFESDSIKSFGHIKSPDKQFEIYTWNTLKEFSTYEYFAFIKFKKGETLELVDKSDYLLTPELKITKTDNWFGALYYEVIPVKNKAKEKYYVLLGWDGNSPTSIKKVIDVLFYNDKLETWQLGKKIFGPPFSDLSRFFLEYSAEVNASLKYHEKDDRIVFDHLVPLNAGLEGVFEFYVPDLSFDAFEFREDRWYFIQNVDVRGDHGMDNYVTPNTNIRLD